MYLAGHIKISDQLFYIVWKDIKSTEVFWCFSPHHKNDVYAVQMGEQPQNPVMSSHLVAKDFYNADYVTEIIKRTKISGKISGWGQDHIITTLIDTMSFAKNYKFDENDILKNMVSNMVATIRQDFYAKDNKLVYEFVRDDLTYTKVFIQMGNVEINLEPVNLKLKESDFELVEVDRFQRKSILSKTIKEISYETLCDELDMSWYKKDGVLQKDYQVIDNIRDFELKIMTPLTKLVVDATNSGGVPVDVAVDTETSGLNVYNLSPDNPDKDHCVAIPISWKADTGFVIFTDMEHFSNIPNEYAARRLATLFEDFKGERTIEIWENDTEAADLQKMDMFADNSNSDDMCGCKRTTYTIVRTAINLIGHNVMFDKRVFIDVGYYFYFNDDTMQLSFNLCSKLVKGSNKLKVLTRKFFKHETPELTDILGRGNEDKYRYLTDKEVAAIYGCADADYTLQVKKVLRGLTPDSLYSRYKTLDVPMLNILPRSEYYGLLVKEEEAFALGDTVRDDIELLKRFAYDYVGIFVNAYKQREKIEAKKVAGLYDSEEEYLQAMQSITANAMQFEFEFTPTELRTVLFEILKYPIMAWTDGAKPLPKLDKYAMKKLIDKKRDQAEPFNRMEKDLISSSTTYEEYERLRSSGDKRSKKKADSLCLISAEQFNKCKYPLALVLQKYAELNKEYTAYYKPMRETNLEQKIFKSYSLARIETRRIQNAAQTMKGNLKALVKAYSDDYYLLDFDMSQVEYRIMVSLAKHMVMIETMKDPERDYHTETASLINSIPAHRVSKDMRKKTKSVSFGVPYGLGERTLCERLFGEVNDDTLFSTRLLLNKWETANKPVMDFLNSERNNALLAREMSNELRDFMDAWQKDDKGNYLLDQFGCKIPKNTGFIYDHYGFYRTFDLTGVDQDENAKKRRKQGKYTSAEAKIRRPAGNFPIQCFAAELFRVILIRFYNRCEAEGINDKIIWHMLIHDELLCSVHKSIHPFFIYKLVKESCMVTMKDHTKYFVGINIGNTWGEVKDDAREAPVYFVDRVVKRWDAGEFGTGPFWFDDPWNDLIKDERANYIDTRINEVIHQIQPNIDREPINIPYIMEHFDNYTVHAYVDGYATNGDVAVTGSKEEQIDREWASKFETWALGHFPSGKPLVNYDNQMIVLRDKRTITAKEEMVLDDLDLSLLFDEDEEAVDNSGYWSFDIQECNNAFDSNVVDYTLEDEEDIFSYEIDENVQGSTIADILKVKNKYENLNVMMEQTVIRVSSKHEKALKSYLENYVSNTGKRVVFNYIEGGAERWLKVSEQIDWQAVDSYVSSLSRFDKLTDSNKKYIPRNFKVVGDNLMITFNTKYKFGNLENWLNEYQAEDGYTIILKSSLGDIRKLPKKYLLYYKDIDNYLDKED